LTPRGARSESGLQLRSVAIEAGDAQGFPFTVPALASLRRQELLRLVPEPVLEGAES